MRALIAVVGLAAATAVAQSSAVGTSDPSRGLTLLPTSSAFSDEATSLTANPAGLSRAGQLNGWYLHERSGTRALDADALFVATSVGDWVGLGLGGQWLRPGAGDASRRFDLGASVGPRPLTLGAALHWLWGGPANGLTALDLGLQSRPLRWLAVGALVRNLNAPSSATTALPREWTLGVGLRPLRERVDVGIDWLIPEATGVGRSRLQYTVNATVLRGLRVSASASHGFTAADPFTVSAALGIDLEHLGYTQGVASTGGRLDWQFAARVSVDRFDSIVPKKTIAVVALGGLGEAPGPTLGSLFGVESEDRFLALLRELDRASADPDLAAVLIKVESSGLGLARADELRAAIERLRATGKRAYAYILSATDVDYLAVAACDGLYAAPEAMMVLDGLRSSVTYFGGAAKALGIEVDVARVGDYKSFPEQFTRTDMSKEQRETLDALLDSNAATVAARVQAGRHLSTERWQAALDEGLKPVQRERELGTIDGVVTPAELDALLRRELPGARVDHAYRPRWQREVRWEERPRIAVIPVLGSIAGGKSRASPLGGALTSGAETFVAALNAAVADPRVAAIVVRVDSGGGDGLASDLMYRAVLEAKKRKPVVSSMGDAAASGGYYVAMGADEIFAAPTTLTGSIGVFFAKPALRGAAEKLGIAHVSLTRGKLAGITDLYDAWTPEQRRAAQRWVDAFYDVFITEVAASRKRSKEEVDRIARGRVWSGQEALTRGLVDRLGGLSDAVAAAQARAGLAGRDVEVSVARPANGVVGTILGAAAPAQLLEAPALVSPTSAVLDAMERLTRDLGASAWLLEAPRPQARLEWLINVE